MGSAAIEVEGKKSETINPSTGDRVNITFYTDPLCCWSWALHPQWEKLKKELNESIHYRYVMGGMIPDWKNYNDPLHAVTRPLQFGPVWMHASQVTGVPMNDSVWHTDPPASSYPACIAVKCATLQSEAAGEEMLNALRKALMIDGKNISRESVIREVANALAKSDSASLNMDMFETAWKDGSGLHAFRADLQQTRFYKIGRYPTLTFTDASGWGIMITGYRPYDVLKDAVHHMLGRSRTEEK